MAGRYKAYPEYKDSGVEWIGVVPSHWQLTKIKFVTKCLDGSRIPLNAEQRGTMQGVFPYWGANCIVDYVDNYLFDEELILLGEDGAPFFDSSKDVAFNVAGRIWPNNHVHVLRPDMHKAEPRFLKYALNCADFHLYISGSTRDKLNQSDMNEIYIRFCSVREQRQIANFLDHETAKIDTLIDRQQQLIKLVKEKRQAVISHAVTKGLNPEAPMSKSGVEWLGEVPEHWERSYLGFESTVKARLGWKGLKAEEYVEEGYAFLATPNIKGMEIDFKNVNYITKERYDESPEIKIAVGDVLVTKDGSTTGTTNIVRTLPTPTTVNSSIAVLRSNSRIDSLYLFYFFVSTYTQNIIKRMQGGMGVPHLFQADLKKFNLLLPPLDEQLDIVSYIEGRIPKVELLLEKATSEIELLQERRTALISAAVTGKIDVRNWQAPAPNQTKKEEAA